MSRAFVVLLLAAACAPHSSPSYGALVPANDGFDVEGTGLQIGFGRAEPGAIAAASKLLGSQPYRRADYGICRRAIWRDGLTMDFRSGTFVGWTDPKARAGLQTGGVPCEV